jgi:hypothetical protein
MSIEHITASEYLDAANRAAANGVDRIPFAQTVKELEGFPGTKQRLAFEFLAMALRVLEVKDDPSGLVSLAACWTGSVEEPRRAEFATLMEKIVLRYIEILGQRGNHPNGIHPFVLTFTMGLLVIREFDQRRFLALLEQLKRQCGDSDPRRAIIVETEQMLSETPPSQPRQ